ncbi:ankyrin repeat domain-containing protein [Cohnella sp.]|uniref:ankyrin repeat domain-containing protein n=1 Tax=Cohnella sp. TaxID=1883426 RepID=UPI00356990E0
MNCTNCGYEMQDNGNFCGQCGTHKDGLGSYPSGRVKQKQRTGWIVTTFILCFALIIILGMTVYSLTGKIGDTSRTMVSGNVPDMVPSEVSIKKPEMDPLNVAVSKNNQDEVVELLANDIEYNVNSALLLAAKNKNKNMIELLLNHYNHNFGISIIDNMWRGKSALNIAVENDDIEMAKFLLDLGADPNSSTESAIWEAVENGSDEMVEILLDYGADPNKLRVNNKYLLTVAKELGFTEKCNLLISAGAKESK